MKTKKTSSTCRVNSLCCLGLLASALYGQQAAPDLILTNGKIITVDDRFTIAQAVAVLGDRIVATGTSQEIAALAGPNTRRIDVRGRSVIPGLIDNHMHLLRAASTWARELRFDGIDSRKQAVEMIRARAKAAAPGEWVYNIGGWAHQQFADDPSPFTREELDRIAPDNPVALQESYYQVFLNSRALQMVGIKDNTPDPPEFVKGSIVRDSAGKSAGVVKGDIAATRAVANKLPRVAPGQLEASADGLIKDMNRAGLTTFGVPGCDNDVLQIMQKWKAQNELNVRVFCIGGAGAASPEQADRSIQQIAGMKLFQGDNYIDDIFFGESVYTPLHDPMFALKSDPRPDQLEQWKRMAMAIAKAGLPLHVHAELHDTINAFLDQVESINKEHSIKNLRWTFAHINQIDAAQLERMKKLGMYAAVHPWAVINGQIMHEGFGDGAYDMPPLRSIQNSGIMWGLGTDGSAANQYLPFTTLYFAVTGKMAGGAKVIKQTVSREDALIAHTRKNAFFVFQEDNLGSIQPGKLADMVVLDRDYLTVPADQIKDIKPAMTLVGGRIVYNSGK
ncbi:MAG: amidohydrolase [Bryobacterales bacterium]|nr:amidohydrolase [Bryobacterales bacterium]MBV9400994.1 amidohydrolase [Bryobacterales bacterium]